MTSIQQDAPKLTSAAVTALLKEPLPGAGTIKAYKLRLFGRGYRQWISAVGPGGIATYITSVNKNFKVCSAEEIAVLVDAWSRAQAEKQKKHDADRAAQIERTAKFVAERDAWATASGARELAPLGRVGIISVTIEGPNRMSIDSNDFTPLTLEEVKKYLRETRDALNALGTRLEPNT